MTLLEKAKLHFENKNYLQITRSVSENKQLTCNGYIVDFTKDFIILHEMDDFRMHGFIIFPMENIENIRYNNTDKYFDKIMAWENEKGKIGLKTEVDLTNWSSIFKTFKKKKKNIIVECENPKIDSFTIGPVEKVTSKSVSLRCFNSKGVLNEELTNIDFEEITKVMFDDLYIEVFSKYLRRRK